MRGFMHKKILLSVIAVITCINSIAFAMPPKPAKCPSVSTIKSTGLAYAAPDSGRYVVAQMSKYDTADTWIFAFVDIQAASSEEALQTGNQLLGTLSGTPLPIAVNSQNVWACLYLTTQGPYGITFTPVSRSAKIGDTLKTIPH